MAFSSDLMDRRSSLCCLPVSILRKHSPLFHRVLDRPSSPPKYLPSSLSYSETSLSPLSNRLSRLTYTWASVSCVLKGLCLKVHFIVQQLDINLNAHARHSRTGQLGKPLCPTFPIWTAQPHQARPRLVRMPFSCQPLPRWQSWPITSRFAFFSG